MEDIATEGGCLEHPSSISEHPHQPASLREVHDPRPRLDNTGDDPCRLLGGLAADNPHVRHPRIALYSHDTMGLGHLRRNLAIARALTQSSLRANVLLIAGVNTATVFKMPQGVDCLTLPALYKESDGRYRPRSLNLSLDELSSVRAKTICGALEAYEPDVFVVDNVPRGVNRELDQALDYLRARGDTRCVLGLRDVLDEPAIVQREWQRRANEQCIRDYYSAVWVYGDRSVYDTIREYDLSSPIAHKIRYTGYLDRYVRSEQPTDGTRPDPLKALDLPPGKLVLCMAGGGQDGELVAEMFCEATLPPETNALLLTGPFLPSAIKQRLQRRLAANPRLRVLDFHPEPSLLLSRAERVIAMGGYNTVSEILSFEKRALIVPRVKPRLEQLIRAKRLEERGLLDVCHPDALTPKVITDWLAEDIASPPPVRKHIDFDGLLRLPSLIEELLNGHARRGDDPIPMGV